MRELDLSATDIFTLLSILISLVSLFLLVVIDYRSRVESNRLKKQFVLFLNETKEKLMREQQN